MKRPPHQDLKIFCSKDHLFEREGKYPSPFEFNQEVADVFDDMISRSIPFYHEMHRLLKGWFQKTYQKDTLVYDLGCSTGTALEYLARQKDQVIDFQAIGIDSSTPMIEKAERKNQDHPNLSFFQGDILHWDYQKTSFVISNYTLPFIKPEDRLLLLKNIRKALVPSGCFFVSDKIKGVSPLIQEEITRVYEAFKEDAGYSQREISRKKQALEQVLIPLNFEEERELFLAAGFTAVQPILVWNQFATFVAM